MLLIYNPREAVFPKLYVDSPTASYPHTSLFHSASTPCYLAISDLATDLPYQPATSPLLSTLTPPTPSSYHRGRLYQVLDGRGCLKSVRSVAANFTRTSTKEHQQEHIHFSHHSVAKMILATHGDTAYAA